MGTALPTGLRGRILAVAITLILVAVAWIGIVSPLVDLYGERADALDDRVQIATRMARLAAQLPALQAKARAAEKSGPPPMLTIEGASDAVAAARLQSLVQDMATQAGASLTNIETIPAESVGAYRRIGLKLSLDAPWPVLVNLMRTVERGRPPILIDDVQIHAAMAPGNGAPQSLDAGFTVYAFRSAAAPEPPPAAAPPPGEPS